MERFKDEGLAESHDDIELVALGAWRQVTGEDAEAFEEQCEEAVAYAEFIGF